jgi:hypothetical protein
MIRFFPEYKKGHSVNPSTKMKLTLYVRNEQVSGTQPRGRTKSNQRTSISYKEKKFRGRSSEDSLLGIRKTIDFDLETNADFSLNLIVGIRSRIARIPFITSVA